jgi:hypothetical protein
MQAQLGRLLPALRDLHVIAGRYKDGWKGFRASDSPSGRKLEKVEAILGLPVQEFERVANLIEDAKFYVEYSEGTRLPKGYGRD